MKRLVADIETNGLDFTGLFENITELHVCCTQDIDTGETWYSTDTQEILDHLGSADILIGHNFIDYDIPVLSKFGLDFKGHHFSSSRQRSRGRYGCF